MTKLLTTAQSFFARQPFAAYMSGAGTVAQGIWMAMLFGAGSISAYMMFVLSGIAMCTLFLGFVASVR